MSDGYGSIPSGALTQPVPFHAFIAEDRVAELQQLVTLGKVAPPTYESTQEKYNYGINHQWLTDAKAAWLDFDWRAEEKHINSFHHWTMPIKDTKGNFMIHFTGLFSANPAAIPVVMLHGWPGSFLEFLQILGILRDRYTPETLPYHIVVPSLPGYAFSSPPPLDKDFRVEDIARVVNTLMVQLGFDRGYVSQGGDIGSKVTRVLAATHDECKAYKDFTLTTMGGLCPTPALFTAAHINFCIMPEPAGASADISQAEKKGLERARDFERLGSAYALTHATKPSTIGLVLSSSPLTLLVWIGEKFRDWTDEDPSIQEILTSVSLYWLTDTFPTSIYPYRQLFTPGNMGAHENPEWKITKPLGYSWFPYELAPIPRAWVQTTGNLVFFREHEHGGHFAALERPEVLLGDFQEFVQQILDDGTLKIA